MQILKAYSKKDSRPSQDQDDEMSDGEVDFQEDMEAIIQVLFNSIFFFLLLIFSKKKQINK